MTRLETSLALSEARNETTLKVKSEGDQFSNFFVPASLTCNLSAQIIASSGVLRAHPGKCLTRFLVSKFEFLRTLPRSLEFGNVVSVLWAAEGNLPGNPCRDIRETLRSGGVISCVVMAGVIKCRGLQHFVWHRSPDAEPVLKAPSRFLPALSGLLPTRMEKPKNGLVESMALISIFCG